jgi:hypothetical protein
MVDEIRWDEKAGLRTGCYTLPSYRRARSTDKLRRPAMKKISTAAVKQNRTFSEQKLTIGLDLGDRSSWYCVLDEAGAIVLDRPHMPGPRDRRDSAATRHACIWYSVTACCPISTAPFGNAAQQACRSVGAASVLSFAAAFLTSTFAGTAAAFPFGRSSRLRLRNFRADLRLIPRCSITPTI